MDYEKKYKETLERAKQLLGTSVAFDRFTIERIFPELKESEGERIRKEIVRFIQMEVEDEIVGNKWLAWLEKQGEQNLIMADSPQLGEQKSTDKFKVGDWVVSGQFVTQIREIAGDGYVNSHNGFISFEDAKYYHLWTIQDAKDGDVLVFKNNIGGIIICKSPSDYDTRSYCRLIRDNLINKEESGWNSTLLVPATKEQRELLFQKMKEAGYEWDSQKKELKEIDTYCQENCKGFQETGKCFADGDCKAKREAESTDKVEQSSINEITIPFGAKDSELQEATYYIPKGFHAEINDDKVVIKKGENPTAWSEEDETRLTNTIIMLKEGASHHFTNFSIVPCVNWLKSLKQRIGG